MGIVATILQAIPIGFVIAITPGAALFGIIQTSISRGFKAGILFALGITISDILIISLCLWGMVSIMDNPTIRFTLSILGGLILIVYGLFTFFNKKSDFSVKKQKEVLDSTGTTSIKPYQCFFKGFAFNFTNPFVWVLWLGITPYSGNTTQLHILFFVSILLTVFIIDLMKSFFAGKIKNIITHQVGYIINRVVGLVFCLLGVIMIVRMSVELYF